MKRYVFHLTKRVPTYLNCGESSESDGGSDSCQKCGESSDGTPSVEGSESEGEVDRESNEAPSEGGSESEGEADLASASEGELDWALDGAEIPDGFWAYATFNTAQPGTAAEAAARIAAKRAVCMLNLLFGAERSPLLMPSSPEGAHTLRRGIATAAAEMGVSQFTSTQKRDSQGGANDVSDQDRTDKIDYARLVWSAYTVLSGRSAPAVSAPAASAPDVSAPDVQAPDVQAPADGEVTVDISYAGKLLKWTMADDSTIADLTAELADSLSVEFSSVVLYSAGVKVRANEAVADFPALSLVEK
jgi:hypothetical protein